MPRQDWDSDNGTPECINFYHRLYVPPSWGIEPASPLIIVQPLSRTPSNTPFKDCVTKILEDINKRWADCRFGKMAPAILKEDIHLQFQCTSGQKSIVGFLERPDKPKPCTAGSLGYFWEYHDFNEPEKAVGLQMSKTLKARNINLAIKFDYDHYLERTGEKDRTPKLKRPRHSAATHDTPPKKKKKKPARDRLSTPPPLPDSPPPHNNPNPFGDDSDQDQSASDNDNNMGQDNAFDDLPPAYPPANTSNQRRPTPSGSGTAKFARTPAVGQRDSPELASQHHSPPPDSPFSAPPRQTRLPPSPKKRPKARPSVSNSTAEKAQASQSETPGASTSAVPPSSQTLPGSPAVSPVKTAQNASQPAASPFARPASASQARSKKPEKTPLTKQPSPTVIGDSDDEMPSLEPASPYIAPTTTSRPRTSKKLSTVAKGKRRAVEPVSNSSATLQEKSKRISKKHPSPKPQSNGYAIALKARVADPKKSADLSYSVGDVLKYISWGTFVANGTVWKDGARSKPGNVEIADFEKQPANYVPPFPIKTEDLTPSGSGSQRPGFVSGSTQASQTPSQPAASTSQSQSQRPENVPLPSSDEMDDDDLPDISQPSYQPLAVKTENPSPVKDPILSRFSGASASRSPNKYSSVKKEKRTAPSPTKGKATVVDLTGDSD